MSDKRAEILGLADMPGWFLDRVHPEPMSGCWLWGGTLNWAGYGTFDLRSERDGKRRPMRMHRYAYMLLRSPDLTMDLDHRCRVRSCCNPDHLRECTDRENCFAPGSQNLTKALSEKTHCVRGHPLNGTSTYRAPGIGARQCRQCRRVRTRDHARANRPRHWQYWKLDAEKVAAIRADTRPQRRIAADYGITQANVSAIKTGKTWRTS